MFKLNKIIIFLLSLCSLQIIAPWTFCAEQPQKIVPAGDKTSPPLNAIILSKIRTNFNQRLQPLISSNDAAILASPQGTILLSRNSSTPLIPASIFKILTSLVAIHHLGHEYRFTTDFYLDRKDNLIIKGYGDPLLISENLDDIARQLSKNIRRIQDIVVDDTFFQNPTLIPGKNQSLQPYDAPNGALCVNFNTVAFKKINGTYVSAEAQTPMVPLAISKAKRSGLKQGRIMLTGSKKETVQYSAELFQYFFKQAGIRVMGKIRLGAINPTNEKLILHYLSPYNLDEVIARLMEFSNNYIANQIFLSSGAKVLGAPATLAKAVQVSNKFIKDQLALPNITMVEGSGLSRLNRISAQNMLVLLKHFDAFYYLLRQGKMEHYKTGTLSDVHTRAGYLEDNEGRRYPFVVMMNTPGKTTDAVMQIFRKTVDAVAKSTAATSAGTVSTSLN